MLASIHIASPWIRHHLGKNQKFSKKIAELKKFIYICILNIMNIKYGLFFVLYKINISGHFYLR
jgi:hypothetical protein